ncbi:coiled-coil domain-containing protein 178 [Latimeria chalumnae]|uniref:Coiled-coil domain containing 178 n=1 Tax=Latimeria chalumnae TaxID=7897 RepID=M3XLA5_LATCH|nr:PREDICTED: coiled-coil domain-containing protein 178 [Latimeria chalumnae]XP_014345277.1 PREDICTED: coiled-coil domain-containing protein 178 [Latimeria chalumnae]|eukprot:XP_014345276.1 PREDICTED: coiled-coil domain-containing protein 178 [Latimeria chalumnae]
MPEAEVLKYTPKKDTHSFYDQPSVSQALLPLVPETKAAVEKQEQDVHVVAGQKSNLYLVYPTRRRSCALVNTPLPCVNKGIQHIQKLEAKIEDWFHQNEDGESYLPLVTKQQERSLRFAASDNLAQDVHCSLNQGNSSDFSFQGVDLARKDVSLNLKLKQDTSAVLTEVTELIGRLEADRQEAEEALNREKNQKKILVKKMDQLSLWRLQQLPAAVQKEHEACAQDIYELQWHVTYKECQLQQVQKQMTKAEAENKRLKDDIDFVKKYCPLVDEKLETDRRALDQLKVAQEKESEILRNVSKDLEAAQASFDDVSSKIEAERDYMRSDLDELMKNLKQLQHELIHLEGMWTSFCSKLEETEKKIVESDKNFKQLLGRVAELKEKEDVLQKKVKSLNFKLENQEVQNSYLSGTVSKLHQEIKVTKANHESQLLQMEEQLKTKTDFLRKLKYNNKAKHLEIEDLNRKIKESEQKKIQLQNEYERLQKAILKNNDQMNTVRRQISQAEGAHTTVRLQLQRLEEDAAKQEAHLKNLIESTKATIMMEKMTSKKLRTQLLVDDTELQKQKRMKENIEDVVEMEAAEAEEIVLEQKRKVESLQNLNKDGEGKLYQLEHTLNDLITTKNKTEEHLINKKNAVQIELADIQKKYEEVSKKNNSTLSEIEHFKRKTYDLRTSLGIIQAASKTTENTIAELQCDYSCLQFKYQNAETIVNNLEYELKECKTRQEQREIVHKNLLRHRQEILNKTTVELEECLCENLSLAQQYRELQEIFLNLKNHVIDLYERRVNLEADLRDCQQLSLLQSRMHKALVEYFKQRGLYSQARLAMFQATSHENTQKILAVQKDFSKAIHRVSSFLHTLTDGSSTEDIKKNNQRNLDAKVKDKKSHTVQITA